jgi:hypothetical protein
MQGKKVPGEYGKRKTLLVILNAGGNLKGRLFQQYHVCLVHYDCGHPYDYALKIISVYDYLLGHC